MLGRKGLAGRVQQSQSSRVPQSLRSRAPALSRLPARAVHTDTAFQDSEQPQQSGSTACRQQLQQHLADLERVLPTLSCSQLANTLSSLALTYQAANLSCEAGAGLSSSKQFAGGAAAADPHAIVEFYNESFPDQSFLLTFRDTVGQYLAQHPASFTFIAAAAAAADADAAGSQQSGVACNACNPAHLAKILASVASLPIMVVQPLPIGFGTPRWNRPLAAADPAAWEAWLADMAAVYTTQLQQQQQQQAAAVSHANNNHQQQLQQQPALEQLADFTVSLACAMRWANVNVNDDRLQTPDCKQQVLRVLQQQQQQPAHQQQQQQDDGLALAGSYAHRLTYAMLLLLLPPPRPLLAAFFEDTAPELTTLFTVDQVQGLIRGCLFLGTVPPEPWLRSCVGMVRFRAQEMPPKDVQGFVEGFRFFGTRAGRAGFLRDATAQLEEFTLC